MKGTKTKKIKQIKNRINEILNKFSFSIDEKKKINKKPNEIYMMCFKKNNSYLYLVCLTQLMRLILKKKISLKKIIKLS